MADADAAAAPLSLPPLQPPSIASLPPPSPPPTLTSAHTPTIASPNAATAATPNVSDTPASAVSATPFSNSSAADTLAFSDAAAEAPDDDDDGTNPAGAKKHMTLRPPPPPAKKSKKKNNNVWTKPASRKGKKKIKQSPVPGAGGAGGPHGAASAEDKVVLAPAPRIAADRSDDTPEAPILLSRVHKAEKVELSEDRLTACSGKGYRMVRATRGVAAGAWYFEIKVARLGPSGHTRLGWATNKGDLQAPVGYDAHGFGYRDIDGSKVHKALREKYGDEGYGEGDVIGFFINLPDGQLYEPKPPVMLWYKGQHYLCNADGKDELPKVVPGSEISFFKNGICQGTAFTDLSGGRYHPAASMYTLPNQPNCEVRFNFGPDFQFFPQDFGGRPIPQPMSNVPYYGYEQKNTRPVENGNTEKTS